jgi:hypothetical protein
MQKIVCTDADQKSSYEKRERELKWCVRSSRRARDECESNASSSLNEWILHRDAAPAMPAMAEKREP